MPRGFFKFKGKLFKHDFKDHEGRPGQIGGSKKRNSPTTREQWELPAKFSHYGIPNRRPDGNHISNKPDRISERKGIRLGSLVRGNVAKDINYEDRPNISAHGEVIGWVWNNPNWLKRNPGDSQADVVFFDEKSGILTFMASRNVYLTRKRS